MKNLQQVKANETKRKCKELGLTGKYVITQSKIESYLSKNPNTSDFIRMIIMNWTKTFAELSKLTKHKESRVRQFYYPAIESVALGKKTIGLKKLSLPGLVKAQQKSKELLAKTGLPADKPFQSAGKDAVRNAVVNTWLDKSSPKKGVVITLSALFDVEKMAMKHKQLDGLKFAVCEFDKSVVSKQRKVLKNDKSLASRVELFDGQNINDYLIEADSNSCAHICLDYCGPIDKNIDTVQDVIENNTLKVGGTLWLTFFQRSQAGYKDVDKVVASLIEKVGGKKYKIEQIEGKDAFAYRGNQKNPNDDRSATNMIAMIIRRVK